MMLSFLETYISKLERSMLNILRLLSKIQAKKAFRFEFKTENIHILD